MIESDVLDLAARLEAVTVLTASEEGGAPEVAWGDSFFYHLPDGGEPGSTDQPFATLVCSDYPGFDVESRLDRPGVFRVNLAVGRERYEQLLGHPAADHAEHHAKFDYARPDIVLPHPLYATQGWVSVVNPGPNTTSLVEELFVHARELAASRHARRQRA